MSTIHSWYIIYLLSDFPRQLALVGYRDEANNSDMIKGKEEEGKEEG